MFLAEICKLDNFALISTPALVALILLFLQMALNRSQLKELAIFYKDNRDVLSSGLNNAVTKKLKDSLWAGLAQKFNAHGADVTPDKLRHVSLTVIKIKKYRFYVFAPLEDLSI